MFTSRRLVITALLVCVCGAPACRHASSGNDDVFLGLENSQALDLLKRFPFYNSVLNVPPKDGRFLYDLVLQHGYQRGLEIGTANGYSALWLGMAFHKTGGKLVTIEIAPEMGEAARQNFRRAGLANVVDSRINDAFKEIPALEGPFDFIFLDARKEDYQQFFNLLYPKLLVGGAITAHNVLDHRAELADFLGTIQNHPNLETTIHQISGRGISVSIRKSKDQ